MVDDTDPDYRHIIDDLRSGGHYRGRPPKPPLNDGGGDGMSPGMEPRIAKLEAQVAAVQVDLAKLAGVPVDVATMKERLSHIPTKVEMKGDIESAVDKAAARVQRTVAIVGGAVGLLVALINYGPRLLN